MARRDQQQALFEFFAGATSPIPATQYQVTPSAAFPSIRTVAKGEPFEMLENMMPVLYVTSPQSREYRQAAQKKFIDYELSAVLLWLTTGLQATSPAESILDSYYGLLDDIANKIRTNKILLTPSYPQGASIRFGEDFTIREQHERLEDSLLIVSQIKIMSTEQVNA